MGGVTESAAHFLSLVTIGSCFILKIPQILNIYEKKSAVGININALVMELISYTITALYNYINGYGLLTYLEYPIILIQQIILIYFVLMYKQELTSQSARFGTIWYVLSVAAFASKAIPPTVLSYLVPFCTPVSGMSKCVYIHAMVQAQSAEATSLLTWEISVATNLFRIFTVYVDSADMNLLFNFTISTFLSTAVLVTAIYYKQRASQIQSEEHND